MPSPDASSVPFWHIIPSALRLSTSYRYPHSFPACRAATHESTTGQAPNNPSAGLLSPDAGATLPSKPSSRNESSQRTNALHVPAHHTPIVMFPLEGLERGVIRDGRRRLSGSGVPGRPQAHRPQGLRSGAGWLASPRNHRVAQRLGRKENCGSLGSRRHLRGGFTAATSLSCSCRLCLARSGWSVGSAIDYAPVRAPNGTRRSLETGRPDSSTAP